MAEWDDKAGKLRPTWTVRFSPWWVMVGCAIAGIVCAGIVFLTFVLGPDAEELNHSVQVVQGGILLLGLTVLTFLVIGPMLAYGVGFALRNNPNHGIHVLAFAGLGLIVGFMLGGLLHPDLATVVAPAAGIGAAVGRMAITKQAKI